MNPMYALSSASLMFCRCEGSPDDASRTHPLNFWRSNSVSNKWIRVVVAPPFLSEDVACWSPSFMSSSLLRGYQPTKEIAALMQARRSGLTLGDIAEHA
jgi:hypothetical protein